MRALVTQRAIALLAIAHLVLLAASVALGQPPAQPASVRRQPAPQVNSPEILPDNRVTFRLRAPKASAVTVSGQFQNGAAMMTKNDAGVWSVTVGPVAPDIYEYSFNVDGVVMIDPGNREIKPMRNPRTSILEIPGDPPLPHDFQNVPHGKVTTHWYTSKSLGRRRALQVYTPPDYDRDPAARFPTLYLFHGSGDDEATWVAHGRAHWIVDNLLAQKRAQPMVIVMLDGHAVVPGVRGPRNANLLAFERDLMDDAMPLVAANYRVRDGANDRAIIGLSMGGGESLFVGLRHPDTFAWVGGMSSSVPEFDKELADASALNRQLKLLWFACGKDDPLLKRNADFDALLTTRGIRHEFAQTEGNHTWPVWRKHLATFVPLLFQGNAHER